MTSMTIKTYHELIEIPTFEDRLAYLRIGGGVGRRTFGSDRYLNQLFYSSYEWKRVRNLIITRDNGCDLGVPGYEIHAELLIHHMNPLSVGDIRDREALVLDPNNLITTTHATHNAIHYGGRSPYPRVVTERTPNDTRLW